MLVVGNLVVVRRVDGGVAAQGEDAVVDGTVQLLGRAPLEVRAAAAVDQQRVAREHGAVVVEDEGKATRGVACRGGGTTRRRSQ